MAPIKGFSLIEILIVLSIVVLLSVIGGPKLLNYLTQGEASALNDAAEKMKRIHKYQTARDKKFQDCNEWAAMAGVKQGQAGMQVTQNAQSGLCILSYKGLQKELDGGFPPVIPSLALDSFTPQNMHRNVTFPSNNGVGNVNTANDCAQICLNNNSCIAFTHSVSMRQCWAFTSGTGTYSQGASVGDGKGYKKL